ncbi:hypothetical protein CVT25_002926 [Psilocybe cyanescens]|uniref:F-box domain-containing protein n=1 Tax=Psilocybe cyanescens TaxID=93625 RepID=A0A409WMZ8_PSICY|nr:hypothetical protein CVT25_002926 [Psilocybe cyanescens]
MTANDKTDTLASTAHPEVKKMFECYAQYGPEERKMFKIADPWVDIIFPYFLVEDIIKIRQVNKWFYVLTHQPVIWKRFLKRIRIPITHLRPTFQYAENVERYEPETIVTTACAMERSWRGNFPKIRSERILTSQCRIVDLKLLPGGKFLVASIKDRCNYRFFINIYALDVMHGSRLLARVPTYYKAYDLQAKYMKYKSVPGIMLFYTRRRFKGGVPANFLENINDFDPRNRHPVPHALTYEAFCIHMPLEPVEKLIHPKIEPSQRPTYIGITRLMAAPFVDALRWRSDSEIHSPSLQDIEGVAMAIFVEDHIGWSSIQIVNIDGLLRASIVCNDHPEFEGVPHRIRAVRYLPCQQGFLVVRSVCTDPMPNPDATVTILFEIYDLPPSATVHHMDAVERWQRDDKWKLDGEFVISDAEFNKTNDEHPDIILRDSGPPTIWVFAPSEEPKGCAYWWIRAERVGQNWRYTETGTNSHHHQNKKFHERALPGAHRTLFLEINNETSEAKFLRKMRRFQWPESRLGRLNPNPMAEITYPITEVPPENARALDDIMFSEDVGHSINRGGGLVASAWDETSGKICVAAENEDFIRLLDIAPVVEPHLRLAYQWEKDLAKASKPEPNQTEPNQMDPIHMIRPQYQTDPNQTIQPYSFLDHLFNRSQFIMRTQGI